MTIIEDLMVTAPPVRQFQVPEQASPSTLDTLAAAFRMENSVSSYLASGERGEAQEDYDPFDEISGYEPFADRFVKSRSPEDTSRIKNNIRRELNDRQVLADAGGLGVAASIGAGVLDPIFLPALLIPGGAVARGESILSVGVKTAVGGAAAGALSELPLQVTQETRTASESAIAIGASALFAGLAGSAVGAFSAREITAAEKAVNADVREVVTGESVGAALVKNTTLEQETLVGAAGFAKVLKITNPLLRTAQSKAKTTRRVSQELVENGLITRKNVEGMRTPDAVETRVKSHDARLAMAVETLDQEYVKFRTGEGGARVARAGIAFRDVVAGGKKSMSFSDFKREVSFALRRNDQHAIPEVAAAARRYRQTVFDPLKDRAIKLGLLPEDVKAVGAPSYLSRMYNWQKIKAERTRFAGILRDWFEKRHGLDPDTARQIAEDVITNIRHTPIGHIPRNIVPTAPSLKSRLLDIPDERIEDFLENDIEVVASHHVHTLAPEIELVERFGKKDMTDQIQEIADEYGVLIEKAKTAKERARLSEAMENDVRDIQAMRDRLLGTFGMPNDPGSFIVRAGRTVRDYNFLRMLGGMTISAIPDLARPVMRHGLRAYAKALGQLASSPARVRLLKRELRAAGVGLDMTLNSRAKAVAEISEVSQFDGALQRAGRNLSTNFGIITLMAPWNAAMKQFAGVMASNEIIHQSAKWAGGTIKGSRRTQLAQSGIDEDLAKRITAQIEKYGDKGDVTLPHADKWDDREAAKIFEAAILKDVDLAIVTPGIGDRPLWMSSEMGKIFGQFKSFQFASTNRVMISGLQTRDAAVLNGTLLTLALGSLVYGIKTSLYGGKISDDPGVLMSESIDRSGLTGILFDVNNISEKFTRGTVGASALTGGPTMSRYQSRNVMGALFGPTADAIPDLAQVGGAISTGEIGESDIHAARKLTPYQNLFYLRSLFDEAERNASQATQ